MKRYVQNDTDRDMIVGGMLIPAGQGREIDTALLPPEPAAEEAPAPPAPPDPDANLRDLLKGTIREIEPLLDDETTSDETLAGLARLEAASETPRQTLLQKIAAEQLKRAQKKVGEPT